MLYTLAIYEPLSVGVARVDVVDINPDVTQLAWSTAIPGGYAGLTVGIARPERRSHYGGAARGYLAREAQVRAFAHVELSIGATPLWEGRVVRTKHNGGTLTGFAAAGYHSALSDAPFLSTSTTTMTSGALVRLAVADAAPLIRVGHAEQFRDPQVEHTPAEFDGMTPAAILDAIAREGGDGVLWDVAVWHARTLYLLPRTRPDTPHYAVPFDASVVEWDEDFGELYTSAAMRYRDSAGAEQTTAWETATTAVERYGVSRAKLLTGSPETAAAAIAFRDTWLAEHSAPQVSGRLVRDAARGLELLGGGELPGHVVRAGQWVRVGTEAALPIVETRFDALTRQLDVTLGRPSPESPRAQLAPARDAARALRDKRDLLTGAKWRW